MKENTKQIFKDVMTRLTSRKFLMAAGIIVILTAMFAAVKKFDAGNYVWGIVAIGGAYITGNVLEKK
jgi:hypothetical protein